MSEKKKTTKVLVIGLDGGTFDLIIPWVEAGKLPNIKKTLRGGSWGPLASTLPYVSPVAWSSFITGKNPGKHGIFNFTYYDDNSYEPKLVSAATREGKSFWTILSEQGKKVCVINVPVTYPPEAINGCMISGLMAPDVNKKICYPPGLYQELISEVGKFSIKAYPTRFIRLGKLDQLVEKFMEVINQRYAVVDYLIENKAWDFFCVVFSSTDHAQHYFWRYMDIGHPLHDSFLAQKYGDCILRVYQKIDSMIGAIINKIDDNTVLMIMSDHGMGSNNSKAVYLNNWLAREGFLYFKDSGKKHDLASNTKDMRMIQSITGFGKKYLPRSIKTKIKRFHILKSRIRAISRLSEIDWARTKAFSDDVRPNIWINLINRHPHGVVRQGQEYESLRDLILKKLKDFVDRETGECIFDKMFKREEIYRGDLVNKAPDIILDQGDRKSGYIYQSSISVRHGLPLKKLSFKEIKENAIRDADHRKKGIFVFKGPNIKKNYQVSNLSIIDLAPTILGLIGVPIPKDMDGKFISEAVDLDFFEKHPLQYSEAVETTDPIYYKGYSEKDIEDIKKNLRGLGYLE